MEIEKVKQDWELNRLKRLKEEEERKAELDDDDMMIYTYTKAEVRNRHASSTNTTCTNSKLAKRNKKKKDKKNKNKKQKSLNNNQTRRDDVKQRLSQRLSDKIKHSPAPSVPTTIITHATPSSTSSNVNKKNPLKNKNINKRKKLPTITHSKSLNSIDKPVTSLGKIKSSNDLSVTDGVAEVVPRPQPESPVTSSSLPKDKNLENSTSMMTMTTTTSPLNTLVSTSTHSLPSTSSHSPSNTVGLNKQPKSNQKENKKTNKSIKNLKLLANTPAPTDSLKLINNTLNEDSSDGASECGSESAKPANLLPDKVKKAKKTPPVDKPFKELKKRGRKPKIQLLQSSNLTNQPPQESNLLSNLNDQIKNMITVVTPTSGGELKSSPGGLIQTPPKMINEKPKVLTLTPTTTATAINSAQLDFRPVLKTFVRPLVTPTTNQPLTLPKSSLPIINITSGGPTSTNTFSRSTPSTPIYITKLPTAANSNISAQQPIKSLNIPTISTVPKLVFKTLNKPIVLPGATITTTPGVLTTTTIAKPPSQINIPRIITTINLNNNNNTNNNKS